MPVNIVIPQAGESVASGVVLKWTKAVGEFIKRDETVLEVETDKVTLEVPAPSAGVLMSQSVKPGDTVAIGATVGVIDEKATAPAAGAAKADIKIEAKAGTPVPTSSASASATATLTAPPHSSGHSETNGDVRATPLAKKTAEQLHVDINTLLGTGPGGKIREADVLGASKSSTTASAPAASSAAPTPPLGGATRERMTPIRMRIAQRLVQAQHTAAMLTTFNECDMTAIMELRKHFKEDFEKKHGVGLGFMGFFVKAVVAGLKAFPLVNASIVEESGQMMVEKHSTCDIAVAVSTPKGLVVPVLRRCESLSFAQIESGIKDLASRARDGKLALDDMQNGTFTITNGGIFGSLMSTPILNPPQSAILGMHTIKSRPVEDPKNQGQIALRPMMYLAVSYDHRLIDGSEAVQFLVKVKQGIEDPQRLMLEL